MVKRTSGGARNMLLLDALTGFISAFAGAGSVCLFVLADQSRNELETYRKSLAFGKGLAVVAIVGFVYLCV